MRIMTKHIQASSATLTTLFASVASAQSPHGYHFTSVNLPGASSTLINGVNDSVSLVGQAVFPPQTTSEGFVLAGSTPDVFEPAGAVATAVLDISNNGLAVGWSFRDPSFTAVDPFIRDSNGAIYTPSLSVFSDIDDVQFNKINDAGVIVGGTIDFAPSFSFSGFIIRTSDPMNIQESEIQLIDLPDGDREFAWGINNSDQVVGTYRPDSSGGTRGFLLEDDGSTFSLIDVPGSSLTRPRAIADDGTIIGTYRLADTGSFDYSFVRRPDGSFFDFAVPGSDMTLVRDINADGTIVGTFITDGVSNGFIAVIPAPGSVSVLAAVSLLASRRRR